MKWLFLSVLIGVGALSASPSHAFNIYQVGNVIEARSYNDLLNRWLPQDFSIWIGTSEGTDYIFFKAETGLKPAMVTEEYGPATQTKLKEIVSKAIRWAGIAEKNKADTTKGLGCFGMKSNERCKKDGNAFDRNQMGVSFFAANGGKQTDLILDIKDRENQFYAAQLYLNLEKIKELQRVIEQIPDRFAKARDTDNKQNLFK